MKARFGLYLSMALNAGLLALLAHGPHKAEERVQGGSMPAPATMPESSRRSTPRHAWIERLREEGIEPRLIASIAMADYEDRWQKRLLDLQQQFSRGEIEANDLENFIAGHEADLASRMRDCLGKADFKAWDRERVLRGFDLKNLKLSAPEAEDLYRIRKSLDRESGDLQMALLRGEIDEADLERQTEANHEAYERELKGLLGQARYASLQTGDSQAGELHRDLARIGASEAQVEAALTEQQRWRERRDRVDEQRRLGLLSDAEFEQQLRELDAERDGHLRETLGSGGLAQLQMQQDDRYRTLQRHAGAWNLSPDDIAYLYTAILQHDEEMRGYQQHHAGDQRADESPEPGALHDLARDHESALLDYLGAERFARLKKSGVVAGPP